MSTTSISTAKVRTPVPPAQKARKAQPPAKPGAGLGQDTLQLSRNLGQATPPVTPPRRPAPPPPPEPPTVDTPDEALPLVLAGKLVEVRNPEHSPASVAIKPLEGESEPTYELLLRNRPTRIRFAGFSPEEAKERLSTTLVAALQASPEAFQALPALTIKQGGILEATVTVKGVPQQVEARPVSDVDGKRTFDVGTEGTTVRFVVPSSLNAYAAMASAAVLYAQVPDHLRMAIKDLAIEAGPNPQDAEWAVKYNMPGFTSAATGGNGKATFYNGARNLNMDIFHHEFGHIMGQRFSTQNKLFPDDWEAAIAGDANIVTSYGATNTDEDFAESWWMYMMLRLEQRVRAHEAPQNLEEFGQKFPRRKAILDAIYEGTRKPAS